MQQEVADTLHRDGFFYARGIGPKEYLALAALLGAVVAVEEIELRPGVGSYACSPGPVPFHTDHPAVTTAAWYCVRQDPGDGASLLVDAQRLVGKLNPEQLALLERLRLAFPPLAAGHSPGAAPVLVPRSDGYGIYYPPVVRPDNPEPRALSALQELADRVREIGPTEQIRIQLEVNDALFVDNRRMLHGRGPLRPNSPRLLRRAWIQRELAPLSFV
ncbi:TauD/TfdA family dioxygenase [Sorangium sp. So ce1182]|uniref:TauD/TfdA family dioxygenase n=1 Tax=Sorangium sp. So ce1182 TaxID=3133334 RepID=UPI003F614B23